MLYKVQMVGVRTFKSFPTPNQTTIHGIYITNLNGFVKHFTLFSIYI